MITETHKKKPETDIRQYTLLCCPKCSRTLLEYSGTARILIRCRRCGAWVQVSPKK